jgi:hypothetical protein
MERILVPTPAISTESFWTTYTFLATKTLPSLTTSETPSTTTETLCAIWTERDGQFAETTITTTLAVEPETFTSGEVPSVPGRGATTTSTDLLSEYAFTIVTNTVKPSETPSCTLASYEQKCQSQWSYYIARESSYVATETINLLPSFEPPSCTQASITGTLCDEARNDYV